VNVEHLTTWLVPAVGIAVAILVVCGVRFVGRLRRRRSGASREEDLPWDQLLEVLRKRRRGRPASLPAADDGDFSPEDDELPDSLLDQFVTDLRAAPRAAPEELPEDREFRTAGGVEKRTSRRRWGNPTEVHVTSATSGRRFGLVINRSTGGLAVLVDNEVAAGVLLGVRSAEAPHYVPTVQVEIRYCRKAGSHFLLGCKFCQDIPWNVRVWFG
jgi:hypothetical protein